MKLWYDRPAREWLEALPLGNGRLGAMVYGGTDREQVWLNEDTFWSGHPRTLEKQSTAETFQAIRELVLRRQYAQAQALFESDMSCRNGESYEPLGVLNLTFPQGEAEDYRRELDLEQGMVRVDYRQNGTCFHREYLTSCPDQVLAISLRADRPGQITLSLELDAPLRHEAAAYGDQAELLVQAPSMVEPSYSNILAEPVEYSDVPGERGIRALATAVIRHEGGTLTREGSKLCLQGADCATILLAAHTSFRSCHEAPDIPDEALRQACQEDLEDAGSYESLRNIHISDYKRFFDRAGFSLEGKSREDLPTDARLEAFDPQDPDMGLYELLFHYGRYLMISGSRPGTQALNLQGIWNHQVRPPWSSNYTLNINTQMNYWPAPACGLEEMMLPLLTLAEDLAQTGRETARVLYGAPGYVCHHNTDLWRFTWPVGGGSRGCTVYAFWNMSPAWLCNQLYDLYRYTGDRAFLEERLYPLMKGAAEYLLAMLVEEDGYLIVSPATSPENSFLYGGKKLSLDKTSAMSQEMTRELFQNTLEAGQALRQDRQFREDLSQALARLKPLAIGPDGRLLEWSEPLQEEEVHHRHLSHLYGAHPGTTITREATPALMEACRQSLLTRGDEGTGWSLAWKVCQWARQGDGARAIQTLNMQFRPVAAESGTNYAGGGGSYPNLFCAHPPFQIDGNFGATAGICEILVQSGRGRVAVLPALPPAWTAGEARGLRCRGGVTLDVRWDETEIFIRLTGKESCEVKLDLPWGEVLPLNLAEGTPIEKTFAWRR